MRNIVFYGNPNKTYTLKGSKNQYKKAIIKDLNKLRAKKVLYGTTPVITSFATGTFLYNGLATNDPMFYVESACLLTATVVSALSAYETTKTQNINNEIKTLKQKKKIMKKI